MLRSQRLGLTIAELMVATGLLTVVLVTVMTLFGQLLKNTNKNSLLSAGAFFGDAVMAQQIETAKAVLRSAPNNSTPAFPEDPIEGEGRLAMTDGSENNATKFLYKVEAEQLEGFTAAGQGQLWFVEVEVRWWTDDRTTPNPTRAGTGNLSIKRGQVTYLSRGEP